MAEQVGSVVVGEAVTRTATFLTSKLEQFFEISEKVKCLELKVIKICSVIEESKKYDLDNKPLLDWQRQLIDAVKEGERVLHLIKTRSDVTNLRSPTESGSPNSFSWLKLQDFIFSAFVSFIDNWKLKYVKSVLLKKEEIEKLNSSLARLEGASNDIGLFLELIRMQKRQRERRRRFKPYSSFFELVYFQLFYDLLEYWSAHLMLLCI